MRSKGCFERWKVRPDAPVLIAKGQVIMVHEFGDQRIPSASTIALMKLAIRLSDQLGIPFVCQFPADTVAAKLDARPFAVISRNEAHPGRYLDTEEVNRQLAELCRKEGWRRVVMCTHPDHVWRAGKNAERHGLVPLYPQLDSIPYDRKCARLFLRHRLLFLPREAVSRAYYWLRGYL